MYRIVVSYGSPDEGLVKEALLKTHELFTLWRDDVDDFVKNINELGHVETDVLGNFVKYFVSDVEDDEAEEKLDQVIKLCVDLGKGYSVIDYYRKGSLASTFKKFEVDDGDVFLIPNARSPETNSCEEEVKFLQEVTAAVEELLKKYFIDPNEDGTWEVSIKFADLTFMSFRWDRDNSLPSYHFAIHNRDNLWLSGAATFHCGWSVNLDNLLTCDAERFLKWFKADPVFAGYSSIKTH